MALLNDLERGVIYILRVLPDSLVTGITVLSILLGNQALFTVAASSIFMQALVTGIGYLVIQFNPDSAVVRASTEPCVAGYINNYWAQVRGGRNNTDHPYAPSLYMATVAFFAGWGAALKQLYADEINQGVLDSTQTTAFLVLAFLIVLIAMIVRTTAPSCESFIGALIGAATGILVGYLLCITIGYSTNRKATNIWGAPLLRDRIDAGSPIYTCPKTG
jgi:hypothetical protein